MTSAYSRRTVLMGSAGGLAALMLPQIAMAQPAMQATGRPYVKKDQINGGEPIKFEYWEWSGQRAEYQRAWAASYSELYPNVEIEMVLQPWDTYWPSLITNVPAGKGPAMWHMHASKWTEFCAGNLMAPIPDSVADADYLNTHWIGFDEGAMACPASGSIHTVPMGAMMPMLFINTDMWAEAGLTEADIPTTWEELRAAGRALTQRDGRGRISVAGLNFNGQEWIQNAVYQQGRYLFDETGTKVQVQNPEYKAALQFISDVVHQDQSLDQEIAETLHNGFVAKKSAMYIGFSWVAGFVRANAGDMNWIAVALPTPDGSNQPAYGNIRFAIEAVVNPFASQELQEVAWDFWHFNYANEETVLNDLALFNGFLPPHDELLPDPRVGEDPVASVLAPAGAYGVINDLPNVIRDEQLELVTAVMLDATDLDGKLAASEKTQNTLLSKRDDWNIIERNYRNHDLMIGDQ